MVDFTLEEVWCCWIILNSWTQSCVKESEEEIKYWNKTSLVLRHGCVMSMVHTYSFLLQGTLFLNDQWFIADSLVDLHSVLSHRLSNDHHLLLFLEWLILNWNELFLHILQGFLEANYTASCTDNFFSDFLLKISIFFSWAISSTLLFFLLSIVRTWPHPSCESCSQWYPSTIFLETWFYQAWIEKRRKSVNIYRPLVKII